MNNLIDLLQLSLPYAVLESADSALVDKISTRYLEEFPTSGEPPSVTRYFEFTPQEIDQLLDLAIKYKAEDLLIALAGMGTVEYNDDRSIKDPADPLIGRRDARIEEAIINKALVKQSQKVPDATRTSSVYGFSGNPPTLNHRSFIEHLAKTSNKVTVVLNTQSPLKDPGSYVPAEHRYEMLTKMITPAPTNCIFSRVEIDRPRPSRMVVTMSILSLLSEADEQLELAMGIDKLGEFNKWYQWINLATLCRLKFYPRQGEGLDATALNNLLENGVSNISLVFNSEEERTSFLETNASFPSERTSIERIPDLSEGSATAIRNWYQQGCPDLEEDQSNLAAKLKELHIHPEVHELIIKNKLFGSSQDASKQISTSTLGFFGQHQPEDAGVDHVTKKHGIEGSTPLDKSGVKRRG